VRKSLSRLLTGALLLGLCAGFSASAFDIRKISENGLLFKYVRAGSWSIVGRNIIVRGGIHIPLGDLEIFADQAVINIENQDIEASGHVRFIAWQHKDEVVDPDKLAALERLPGTLVEIKGVKGDIWGRQQVKVTITRTTDNISADRLVGNLSSGYFRFDGVSARYATFVCRAKSAERRPDGAIEASEAEISSCSYLEHDNAHYAIAAKRVRLMPRETEFFGTKTIVTDPGDHSVLIFNGVAKVYGVPLLWLPVFYKPKDVSPGLFSIQFGKSSSWGYYLALSKYFNLTEYPNSGFRLHGDYYQKRGFGYGVTGDIVSEQSRTDFFAYSIYDLRPYETDDYDKYRLKVPHGRFDFRISNVTHITPRLDFRGAFEYASDLYFVRDFFSHRYNANPQPATYAALEQQFDHFSASILFRPRVNSFYTVSEKLPEVRLDIPRQEIFGTNFYYQGDFDASYNRMKWIDFDFDYDGSHNPVNNVLRDYQAFRFDTTHFLYFPIRLDWLTVVPRAGFKMTAYSNSTEGAVSTNDLLTMFIAADPQNISNVSYRNYDRDGGVRVRSLGELGFEASTKIHNTWDDVRVPFLRLDGLRHIMRPYINYTWIGTPSTDRDYLFYFDDTDRIERQHFFRFGLENRLQTRESDRRVRNYFSMENYWDLYLENAKGFGNIDEFNRIGNFCTTLTASPIDRLTLSTSLIADIGGNNDQVPEVDRRGRSGGRPGFNGRWLNRWNASLTYEPIDDVKINFSYTYNRPYAARSTYSMGSTLYQMDAGGFFDKYFKDANELVSAGIAFPITPDRRTRGAVRCSYDVIDGSFSSVSFMVARTFHCWEVIAAFSFSRDSGDDDHDWETGFSIQARLVGLESPHWQKGNEMASKAAGTFDSDGDKRKYF